MIKLDLQFFGGRGSASSGGGTGKVGEGYGGTGKPLGLAGQTYFEDGNKTSVAGTLNYWENKSKDLKHEELLLIDEDGFACGYFKGGDRSVKFDIPKDVDPSKTVLTHNHPYGTKATQYRTIGGSFSNKDLENHIKFGFKETRATTIEGTYSFKATKGTTQNKSGFLAALSKRKDECTMKADKAFKKAQAKGSKKSYIDTYLETCDKWYKINCGKFGYTYSFTPAKK